MCCSTRSVGFYPLPKELVNRERRNVAEELGLAPDWLDDAAKAFVPEGTGYETWQAFSNLTVSTIDDRCRPQILSRR
jgi:hypothetical protein